MSQRDRFLRLLVPCFAGVQHQGKDAPLAWGQMEQKLALLEEAVDGVLVPHDQATQSAQDFRWHCG